MKRVATLIVAVLAAVIGLLLFNRPISAPKPVTVDRSPSDSAHGQDAVTSSEVEQENAQSGERVRLTAQSGTAPKAPEVLQRNSPKSILAAANLYSRAIAEANLRGTSDIEAINERIRLAFVCSSMSAKDRIQQLESKQLTASKRAQIAFFDRFCDSIAESMDPLIAELERQVDSDIAKATTLHETTAIDARAGVEDAMRILFESDSPAALTAVSRFLDENASVTLDFGLADLSRLPNGIDKNAVRRLAVEMIACEMSGACGPDSIDAWLVCDRIGTCHPGISMQEIWRASYAPIVYDAAVRQANQLRSIRSNRQH